MHPTLTGRSANVGLMAILTLFGIGVSGWMPLFGSLVLAVAGLPALLVLLAWGGAWFGAYGALVLGGIAFWKGWASAVVLIPLLLAPAAVLAGTLRGGLPPFAALGTSVLVASLLSLALWSVAPLLGPMGTSLWAVADDLHRQERLIEDRLARLARDNENVDPSALSFFTEQLRQWVEFTALLVPVTFVVLWHLVSLTVLYLGGLHLGRRFGLALPPLPPFAAWRFDWRLIWVFLAGWILFHVSDVFIGSDLYQPLRQIGANCLTLGKVLYFLMGLSLMCFFFDTWSISRPNRIGLSILAVFFHQLLVWLGIVDVWLDFRAPKAPPVRRQGESEEDGGFFF